jgi:ornithine carbamoyltransferase
MLLTALLGVPLVIASPPGYEPHQQIQTLARSLGGRIELTHDPKEAAVGADVLYTDVWISMGQEAEREERLETFRRYQLNERLVGFAKPGALIMHCLPAHRNEEITDAVLDGPQSIVFDQAENRLHVQKAILLTLLGE